MAIITYNWDALPRTYLANHSNDANFDDAFAVLPSPLRVQKISLAGGSGYYHYHDPGQRAQVLLREVGTGTWHVVYDELIPASNLNLAGLAFDVPASVKSLTVDAFRIRSQPYVNQGFHDVGGFSIALEITQVGLEGANAINAYGSRAYGSSSGIIARGPVAVAMVSSGGATASAKMTVVRRTGDLTVIPSSPEPEDITLIQAEGPNTFGMISGGGSTVAVDVGNQQSTVITSNGVSGPNTAFINRFFSGDDDPFQANGRADLPNHHLYVVDKDSFFTVYSSKPPYKGPDVLVAPSTGPLSVRGNTSMVGGFHIGVDMIGGDYQETSETNNVGNLFTFVEAGSSMTAEVGLQRPAQGIAAGKATATAQQGQIFAIRATSNGVAGARNPINGTQTWYMGSTERIAFTSAGKTRMKTINNVFDSWYLSGPIPIESTSNGRGGVRDQFGTAGFWYLGSNIRMTATSNGRSAVTKNFVSSAIYVVISANGRAGGTVYLSSPIRIEARSNGKATVPTNYLSSRVPFFTTMAGRAVATMYLASRIPLTTAMPGRGDMTVDYFPGALPAFRPRGVGRFTVNMGVIEGAIKQLGMRANAGCRAFDGYRPDTNPQFFSNWGGPNSSHTGYTGPQGVFFYQTGRTYSRIVSNGKATMRENEEFMPWNFRMTINSGTRAYRDRHFGRDVSIYLSSTLPFLNNDPNNDWHLTGPQNSTFRGKSTVFFAPEMSVYILAGCRSFTSYPADRDPAVGGNGVGGRPGGVRMYQTGVTYLTWPGSYYISRPVLVHITLSAPQRLYWQTATGIATVQIGRDETIAFNGVSDIPYNWIINESYANSFRWHSWNDGDGDGTLYPRPSPGAKDPRARRAGGVGHMEMYGAGRTEVETTFRGFGGMPNYLNGPVYMAAESDGIAGPPELRDEFNRVVRPAAPLIFDLFGFYQEWTANAGVYPYITTRPPTDTDPGGQQDVHPGIEFRQDRVQPALLQTITSISTMTIEIEGAPILRIRSNGVSTVSHAGFLVTRFYGGFTAYAGSYGWRSYSAAYPPGFGNSWHGMFEGREYGFTATAFQHRDAFFNGVGDFIEPTLGLAYFLEWQKWSDGGVIWPDGKPFYEFGLDRRAGGVAHMTVDDERRFMEARTWTNLHQWANNVNRYVARTRPVYVPDAWKQYVVWQLEHRSRGRARFRDKYLGDLLARYYSAPQPGVPTIDGHERPEHGQYWPRHIVLPWRSVGVSHPQWHEYEYYRR